jgi:AraC-like DNA-binding protein
MITELLLMELASDQQKIQRHEHAQFPCSAYFTNWKKEGINGVPWHWHREFEFMFVVKGTVKGSFGSEQAILHEGDGFFVNSGNFHSILMEDCERCQVRSFVFDPVLVSGGSDTLFHEKYILPLISVSAFPGTALYDRAPTHHIVLEHIKKAHRASEDEQGAYEYDVRYHLSKALYYIYKDNEQLLTERRDIVVHSHRTRAMLDYIHKHYDEPITLADLAEEISVCDREVQRYFRKDLNTSPVSYIRHYRIHVACKMLLDSQKPVTEIGLACGFSNSSHFCRIFREVMGCSPQSFRKKNL